MNENADKMNSRLMPPTYTDSKSPGDSNRRFSTRNERFAWFIRPVCHSIMKSWHIFSQDRGVGSEVCGFAILCQRDSHISFVGEELAS